MLRIEPRLRLELGLLMRVQRLQLCIDVRGREIEDQPLCAAFIEVENVKALYAEYVTAGAMFDQKLKKQAWGGRDFIVRDPDGNGICFVGPAA